MREIIPEEEFDLTPDMFYSALERIKSKNAKKYEFILKGGKSLIDSLYFLCQSVWSSEEIPDNWKKTKIIQIYKSKGSLNDLSNYRNIHTKVENRKVLGEILTHELKKRVPENLSKFQIGSIPGHRPQEHIFSIKSTIALFNSKKKGLLLCLYDVRQFFNKENLRDCCGELYKLGIRGKLYRLTFNLNKDTEVSVRMPVGDTEECEVKEIVAQGTSES